MTGGFDVCSRSLLTDRGFLDFGDCEGDLEEVLLLLFGLFGSDNGGVRLGDVFFEFVNSCGR